MTSSMQGSYFFAGSLLAFLFISFGCWSPQGRALTELDDSELSPDEVLDTKPLIGLKPGDEKMFAVHARGRSGNGAIDRYDRTTLSDTAVVVIVIARELRKFLRRVLLGQKKHLAIWR